MQSPKIMIIRHGEKPKKKAKGVDYDSKKDDNSLIVRGWQRAGALVHIFVGDLTPKFLHACYKSDHAQRALDTITPLAQYLSVKIDTLIPKGKEPKMAKLAISQNGPVLISWEHDAIHLIGNAIMQDETTVPQVWPSDRFDVVYIFDLNPKTGRYVFSQRPQMALVGDKLALIPK